MRYAHVLKAFKGISGTVLSDLEKEQFRRKHWRSPWPDPYMNFHWCLSPYREHRRNFSKRLPVTVRSEQISEKLSYFPGGLDIMAQQWRWEHELDSYVFLWSLICAQAARPFCDSLSTVVKLEMLGSISCVLCENQWDSLRKASLCKLIGSLLCSRLCGDPASDFLWFWWALNGPDRKWRSL